jgi:hypothetical protein
VTGGRNVGDPDRDAIGKAIKDLADQNAGIQSNGLARFQIDLNIVRFCDLAQEGDEVFALWYLSPSRAFATPGWPESYRSREQSVFCLDDLAWRLATQLVALAYLANVTRFTVVGNRILVTT